VAVQQGLRRQVQLKESARRSCRNPHPVRQASSGSKRPACAANPRHLLGLAASSVPHPIHVPPVPRRWEVRRVHLKRINV
jgi:hypothetical protein